MPIGFFFHGSPTPPGGQHCPTFSRREGGYPALIGPTTGRPGTLVVLAVDVPTENKSGHYVGPSGRIGFWFNLPFASWPSVYSSDGPPKTNGGVAVIHLGEVAVAGLCSFRATFHVPRVPTGAYDIVPIEHVDGNAAAFPAIEFSVT